MTLKNFISDEHLLIELRGSNTRINSLDDFLGDHNRVNVLNKGIERSHHEKSSLATESIPSSND